MRYVLVSLLPSESQQVSFFIVYRTAMMVCIYGMRAWYRGVEKSLARNDDVQKIPVRNVG